MQCSPRHLACQFLSIDDDPSAFSTSFEAAAAESRACMVAVVEQVLAKTGAGLMCHGIESPGACMLCTTQKCIKPGCLQH